MAEVPPMNRPRCPCIECEIDRERGRRQYVMVWRDDAYYSRFTSDFTAPKGRATLLGPKHAHSFGLSFKRLRARVGQ